MESDKNQLPLRKLVLKQHIVKKVVYIRPMMCLQGNPNLVLLDMHVAQTPGVLYAATTSLNVKLYLFMHGFNSGASDSN